MSTQREIARALGLSQAAVSQALAGHARIPEATRARVREAARRLGHRADPALAALAARRWRGATRPAALAWLASDTDGDDRYLLAARRRCRERGLRLLEIPRSRLGDGAALADGLLARGVRGLLVGQTTLGRRPWAMPWEDFAVVHCGLYVPPSTGDVVAPDLLGAVDMGWRALLARGFRRIAAVLPIDQRALPEQVLAGSLLALERAVGDRRQLAAWVGPRAQIAVAVAWLRGRRCDAVLGYDEALWLRLRRAGVTAPYAAVAVSAEGSQVAGLRLPFAAIGAAAVDMLEAKLRHGERGDGGGRRIHLLPTPWGDGASLPGRISP